VDHRYGAPRTQIWLKRVHNLKVNTRTIQRIFKEIGMPALTKTPMAAPADDALRKGRTRGLGAS
jgi:hypothetical protein